MFLQNCDRQTIWDAFTKPDACGQGLSGCWKEVAIEVAHYLLDENNHNYLRMAPVVRPLAMEMAHHLLEQKVDERTTPSDIRMYHTYGYIVAQHLASVDPRHVTDHALEHGLKDSFDSDAPQHAQTFVLALVANKPTVGPVVARTMMNKLRKPWLRFSPPSESETLSVQRVLNFLPRFAEICPDQIDPKLLKLVDLRCGDPGAVAHEGLKEIRTAANATRSALSLTPQNNAPAPSAR